MIVTLVLCILTMAVNVKSQTYGNYGNHQGTAFLPGIGSYTKSFEIPAFPAVPNKPSYKRPAREAQLNDNELSGMWPMSRL